MLFSACHKADIDRFDHKHKISKTWENDTDSMPTTYYYEDGKLTTVRFPDYPHLHFIYEKKFQVKRINFEGADGQISEWADITYKDDRVEEIKIYANSELVANQKFVTENRKIAKIFSYILPNYFEEKAAVKNMLFDVQSLELLAVRSKSKGELTLESEHNITYTGDNITTVITYDKRSEDTVITRYTYDENKNPYYGLNFNFMGLKGYSRNNQVSQTLSYGTITRNFTYTYICNKHRYPTIINEKEGKTEEGVNTYIEYVK